MQRRGFTLVELIFVIVVIGILAAVAVPKFKNLKQNAELSNVIAAYTNVIQNAGASFFNETELNGIKASDLNMTDFLKVQNYQPTTGKGWWKSSDNDTVRYYIDPASYISFYYNNSIYDPSITIYVRMANSYIKTEMQRKLQNKLGLIFENDANTTIVKLGEE